MCLPHRYSFLVRDEDFPSNLNLSQWVWKECTCQWCAPDHERLQYCVSCGHEYSVLQWTDSDRPGDGYSYSHVHVHRS
jgi:hypothetical protein